MGAKDVKALKRHVSKLILRSWSSQMMLLLCVPVEPFIRSRSQSLPKFQTSLFFKALPLQREQKQTKRHRLFFFRLKQIRAFLQAKGLSLSFKANCACLQAVNGFLDLPTVLLTPLLQMGPYLMLPGGNLHQRTAPSCIFWHLKRDAYHTHRHF